jgi:adenylyltransferase/sulfurtransferase
MDKPFVFGAVSMYEGQIAVFNKQIDLNTYSTNYRDLFPEQPMEHEVLSCAEAGVIGALPGIIGSIQAMEVIKLLASLGEPLVNKLFTYNALSNEIFTTELVKHPDANKFRPSTINDFILFDYDESCDSKLVTEIDVDQFFIHLKDSLLVDVRELEEKPVLSALNLDNYLNLPLALLQSKMEILANKKVIFVCQSGRRSMLAAKYLASQNHPTAIYSLKGGVVALNKKIITGA